MAYKFAKEELEPNAAEWDEKKHFPIEIYKKGAELGFGGIMIGEEFGGCGLERIESCLIFEALSTGCVGSSAYISIHNMVGNCIYKFGSDYLKN
jgi:alkylation response protein AidB-like acyl-CoA dehydrogenase